MAVCSVNPNDENRGWLWCFVELDSHRSRGVRSQWTVTVVSLRSDEGKMADRSSLQPADYKWSTLDTLQSKGRLRGTTLLFHDHMLHYLVSNKKLQSTAYILHHTFIIISCFTLFRLC